MESAGKTYNVAPNPADGVNGNMPIGAVMLWTAPIAPFGFLLANGSAISRNDFGSLFSVIGTTYGVGNGTTTFNLPNMNGRVVRGLDGGNVNYDTLGETGGADGTELTALNLPTHGHGITDPGHEHGLTNVAEDNQFNNGTAGINRVSQIQSRVAATNTANTGISVNVSAPDYIDPSGNRVQVPQPPAAVDVRNPYITLNYIIKAQ